MGTAKKTEVKACFIAGPFSATRLREALDQLGVRIASAGSASTPLLAQVRAEIERADFVCGVLTGAKDTQALLEVGIAIGLRKPFLLLVRSVNDVPFELRNNNVIEGLEINEHALRFHLKLFVDNLSSVKQSQYRVYAQASRRATSGTSLTGLTGKGGPRSDRGTGALRAGSPRWGSGRLRRGRWSGG